MNDAKVIYRIIATIVAVLLIIAGIVYADAHITTSQHSAGVVTISTAGDNVRLTDNACTERVLHKARKHHASRKAARHVAGAVCYFHVAETGKHSVVLKHSKTAREIDQGPTIRTTAWTEVCSLTCGLWHAKMTLVYKHNQTAVWGVSTDCTNYGGLNVDFTIEGCSFKPKTAFVGEQNNGIRAYEPFEVKASMGVMSFTAHHWQAARAYPSGRVFFAR